MRKKMSVALRITTLDVYGLSKKEMMGPGWRKGVWKTTDINHLGRSFLSEID